MKPCYKQLFEERTKMIILQKGISNKRGTKIYMCFMMFKKKTVCLKRQLFPACSGCRDGCLQGLRITAGLNGLWILPTLAVLL